MKNLRTVASNSLKYISGISRMSAGSVWVTNLVSEMVIVVDDMTDSSKGNIRLIRLLNVGFPAVTLARTSSII